MKKSFSFILFIFVVSTSSLFAGTVTWNDLGMDGNWENPANWDKNRVPGVDEVDDDVVIDGAYTVTIQSNQTIESLRLRNGAKLTIAATYTLTVFDNGSDGVRIEDTTGELVVNGTLDTSEHGGYGIKIDSVGAVMTINGTVNSYNNNDDGVKLKGPGSILTVNGTLNSFSNSKDGIDVEKGNSLIIPSSGKLYLNDAGSDGINIDETLTNYGLISISNPDDVGFNTGGNSNKELHNYGIITVTGGVVGIDGKDTSWDMYNYSSGVITLTESDTLIDDGSDLNNFGTLKVDGYLENGNNGDVNFRPGSTLEPGPSPAVGQLTLYEEVDLTSVIINIDIEGSTTPGTDYDNIVVQDGPDHDHGDVTLTGATLNLLGNYTPVGGDVFTILEKTAAGAIDGTFSGLSEGATFSYKGGDLMISYTGGDGNDVTLTSLSPLPIELIAFNAKAFESNVRIEWTTATETDNDFFTIERSQDGRTFEKIATITGNGNTTEISKYYTMDNNPHNGLNYYRLKQTDFDGQFSYSNIKTVEFRNNEDIKVYPTLVADQLTIETESGGLNTDLSIVIRDLTGRTSKSFAISAKESKNEISLFDLTPGNYFITIYDKENIKTFKFIKL